MWKRLQNRIVLECHEMRIEVSASPVAHSTRFCQGKWNVEAFRNFIILECHEMRIEVSASPVA